MLVSSTGPKDYCPWNKDYSIEEGNWGVCVVEMFGIRKGIREKWLGDDGDGE
jgi:hypothetical protein